MNNPQQILNQAQLALKADLCDTYKIDPSEVIFFDDEAEPFLGYEAMCVMANTLIPDLAGIELETVDNSFVDALTVKTILTFGTGKVRSAVGVVNVNEKIGEVVMNPQQRQQTASSRSMRNALRTAGKDLIRLHREERFVGQESSDKEFSGPKRYRETLLARVHILGKEAGLIEGGDKSLWHRAISNRYSGARGSNELGDAQLEDFAAFLSSLRPLAKAA